MVEIDDFVAWFQRGKEQGWVSDIYCGTHEGPPLTEEEEQDWEDGGDPCVFEMRIWES